MRKLFDQFEQLSTEAQALLEKGISQMRDGFAPAPSLCQKITSTLSSLRTAYDDIRRTLPDHVLTEELPEGELPVCEYEEVWKNSVVSRKKAVRAVLDEFIRVYSDENCMISFWIVLLSAPELSKDCTRKNTIFVK